MPVFQTDVLICTVAYVKAKSKSEAYRKLIAHDETSVEFRNQVINEIEVSGLPIDSPDLPELSISPYMTVLVRTKNGRKLLPRDFAKCV
ncbi:hypothetical protein GR212_15650 [Rhizobium lusitanum]|uniref:Uncharacterized protein n=1 Tax=Rhizobium lusitanum TaxID=293958 RepID=A0A6L9U511_9HYPH|nr:hypothetical protein [Rhizobium lusitanum]NEI71013.1 hypothetical protein [Rhizobium lusitanum]